MENHLADSVSVVNNADAEILNLIIYAVIALFLMSIIAEKLVVLIRKYPRQCQFMTILFCGILMIISFISLGVSLMYIVLIVFLTWLAAVSLIARYWNRFIEPLRDLPEGKGPEGKEYEYEFKTGLLRIFSGSLNRIYKKHKGSGFLKIIFRFLVWSNPFKNITKIDGKSTPDVAVKEITALSFLIGFFVAVIFNASLFDIFSLNPGGFPKAITSDNIMFKDIFDGWKFSSNLKFAPVTFLGYLLTGFFLSFGSKFFHDLLDKLYYVKKAKRALGDPDTYFKDNPDAVAKLLEGYESDFIMAAYSKARVELMAHDEVQAISLGQDSEGYYISLVMKSKASPIPEHYSYTRSDGSIYKIRIKKDILNGEKIVIHNTRLHASIGSKDAPGVTGTLGCLVQGAVESNNEKKYILTCLHNLVSPITEIQSKDFKSESIKPEIPDATFELGRMENYAWSSDLDAAIIDILKEDDISEIINSVCGAPGEGIPRGIRKVDTLEKNKTRVWFCGAASKNKTGIVTEEYGDVEFDYDIGKLSQMNSLIVIKEDGKGISESGDSGSVILDGQNRVVGILLGGYSGATYVIPIENILTRFKVKIYEEVSKT